MSSWHVPADTGAKGISAFVVERAPQDCPSGPSEAKMGWNAQPTRQVMLDAVRIPAGNLLGGEGDGFRIAMNGLNGGRVNIGASSLGGAEPPWTNPIVYMPTGRHSAQPSTELQALQFYVADMATRWRRPGCCCGRRPAPSTPRVSRMRQAMRDGEEVRDGHRL